MKYVAIFILIFLAEMSAWGQEPIDMENYQLLFDSHPSGDNYIQSTLNGSSTTSGNWIFKSRFDHIVFDAGENNSNRRFLIFKSGENEIARFSNNLCFGVGTNNPQRKLHVSYSGNVFSGKYNYRTIASFENSNPYGTTISIIAKSTGYSGIFFGNEDLETIGQISYFHTDNSLRLGTQSSNNDLIIDHNGNVGINIISPKAKLDVAGTIRATEIKVKAQTADFVFEDNYPLRTLDEVEAFIKENGHLPDFCGAEEMKSSGVNLAEMNKLLLQKVEELTLYAIERANEVKKLKEDRTRETETREELEAEVKRQKTDIEAMKNELSEIKAFLMNR